MNTSTSAAKTVTLVGDPFVPQAEQVYLLTDDLYSKRTTERWLWLAVNCPEVKFINIIEGIVL